MNRKMLAIKRSGYWPLAALFLAGCAAGNPPPSAVVRLPNPSVQKCLQEGLRLEPVIINGVVTDYFCISADNRLRCEAWAYFRGECSLQVLPPDMPRRIKPVE